MRKLAPFLTLSLLASTVLAADEPPVEGDGRTRAYLQSLHGKLHRLWADTFLVMAEGQLPKDHPINDRSRVAELEVVLTPEGKLADVKVAKPSGSQDFDSSAMDVVKASAPFAVAPEEALSDDGKVHVVWKMARDDRRCSGLAVAVQILPLDEAVPLLVAQGRESLALDRLKAADDNDRPVGFSKLARAWLDRAEDDKDLAVRVAVANASAGDGRGAERLRKAVASGEQAALAAQGLALLKTGLCRLVQDQLADPQAKTSGPDAVNAPADGDCVAAVVGMAKDSRAPTPDRIAAVQALARRDETEARAALAKLAKDATPTVRAAAILAEARPGAGKGAVFRLTALLRDRSLDVRIAAAAALVRVGGEDALPQLFLLFKEKDARAYEAVAAELATLSGEPSAQMLGRFLHKDDRRIQLAGARALARRQDASAAKELATLAASKDAELAFLAAATAADADKRKAAAAAAEGYAWADSFRTLAEGGGKLAAVDWTLAQFPKLGPETRIDIMGTWLATNSPQPK